MTVPALPTTEELQVLARSLARRVAHRPADIDDLMQEGLWSAQRRLQKTRLPRKPFALARTVMLRSMYTYYSGGWRTSGAKHYEDLPFEAAPPALSVHNPQTGWHDRQEIDEYLAALASAEGLLARHIAENMITPRDPAYCHQLVTTAAARTHSPKKIRPSQKQLRLSLNLNRSTWRRLIRQVREFTAVWLSTHYNVQPKWLAERGT